MDNNENNSPYFSLVLASLSHPEEVEVSLADIMNVMDKRVPDHYEIILVGKNDNGVLDHAASLASEYSQLSVIEDEGPAVVKGWEVARGNILSLLDGKISNTGDTLTQVVDAISDGADLAVASRYDKQTEGQSAFGCFAIRKHCLSNLHNATDKYQLLIEVLGTDHINKIKAAL